MKSTDFSIFIQAFMAMFAILNPILAATIFVSMTEGMDPKQVRKEALKASIVIVVILTGAAFGGTLVLKFLGIPLSAFEAAGGLIILMMGMHMLGGKTTTVQHRTTHGTPTQEGATPRYRPPERGVTHRTPGLKPRSEGRRGPSEP